ncbi:hypothetical protein SAY86_017950 [Trapa natans]|uniref:Uncharacterized protein n=1 Tax=Trapa natans TaxID=22666 RepID=A0AAN7LQG6_TRANT|nr:hypothetical protein SAY86_017950 [Trapa natans]
MFRFSHHVPSHLLTGKEAQRALMGCWELDPAATPLLLIHAASNAQGMGNQEAVSELDMEFDMPVVKGHEKNQGIRDINNGASS